MDLILFRLVQTSGPQQVLLQQRGNLVIGQPIVTVTTDSKSFLSLKWEELLQLQVQHDPTTTYKENNLQATYLPTDPSLPNTR